MRWAQFALCRNHRKSTVTSSKSFFSYENLRLSCLLPTLPLPLHSESAELHWVHTRAHQSWLEDDAQGTLSERRKELLHHGCNDKIAILIDTKSIH